MYNVAGSPTPRRKILEDKCFPIDFGPCPTLVFQKF